MGASQHMSNSEEQSKSPPHSYPSQFSNPPLRQQHRPGSHQQPTFALRAMTSDCDAVPAGRANQEEMIFFLWPHEISRPLPAFERPSHSTTLAASSFSLQGLNGDSPVPLGWKPPATARHVGYIRSPTAWRHGAGETKAPCPRCCSESHHCIPLPQRTPHQHWDGFCEYLPQCK